MPGIPRGRASGKVGLCEGARLRLELVTLASITHVHRAIRDRDARLDLVAGSLSHFSDWDPEALEVLMWTCPAWVIARGKAKDRHHELICGGQFLPSLRMLLPCTSLIPVMLVDTKFPAPRILRMAAAHAAAMAEAARCRSAKSILRMLADAADHEALVLQRPAATSRTTAPGRRAAGTKARIRRGQPT